MSLERGSPAEIPLHSLFPQASASDLKRIRQAATDVDTAHRPSGVTWEWALQHVTFPGTSVGGSPQILLATIILDTEGPGEWFELDIDVEWTPLGQLRAVTTVNVACFCDTDHSTHNIDELAMTVDQKTSLGEAFETATRQLIIWLNDPHTPSWWRAKVGLPNPNRARP